MPDKKLCFIIMPFRKELEEVYSHGIKPAVEESGYRCVRAKEIIGAGNITRIIIEHILQADVVVADLTGQNPNVFYELGVAHSVGNKTIMITQDIQSIPFDISSYRVVSYEQTIEGAHRLCEQLLKEIRNIDSWSRRPGNPVQDFGIQIPQIDVGMKHFNKRLTAIETQIKSESSTRVQQESFANFETILNRLDNLEETLSSLVKESRKPEVNERIRKAEIADLPPGLVEAVRQRRVLLFTGAGISVAAGMPTAKELLFIVQKKVSLSDIADFPNAMATAEAKIGRHELVSTVIAALRKGGLQPSKVHSLIASIGFDVIVTTNFDILLEEAFRGAGRTCFPVVHPEELAYADTNDILLIKIHGSIDRPDSLLLTSTDYRDFEAQKALLIQTLTHYFVTRSIIFVGYSLTDESLLRVIRDIGSKLGAHRRPAYLVSPSKDVAVIDRMRKIWPITLIPENAETFFEKLSAATGSTS
jgi:nucleoside 2-deoxyribosyltransferase